MMTTLEMGRLLDREGSIALLPRSEGALSVNVKITDVRNVYGKDQVLITPVSGKGRVWVELSRVALTPPCTSRS